MLLRLQHSHGGRKGNTSESYGSSREASDDWVLDDGKPNLYFFSEHFGSSRVQVADCGVKEFTDQKRIGMSVSEYIGRWLQLRSSNEGSDCGGELLYLKDWHFVKEYPEYVAYTTPNIFLDDWLNLYLDSYRMHVDNDTVQKVNEICCSDYRFVYMGAKGTWTPLHADVFRSYSWSANICGRKKWYFLSPNQHHLVFDRYMKSSVYDIFEDVCKSKYPGFEKAIWLECTQEQHEIIFVPSGWYHQVHNLEDTISINHNWFNAYNISWVWELLLNEYKVAKEYIEDIRDIADDFEALCQRNLAANAGMDFQDFFIFMIRFAMANLVLLYLLRIDLRDITWSSSEIFRHLLLNLRSIQSVILKMQSAYESEKCDFAIISLRETIVDPTFMDFCNALGRSCCIMHDVHEIDINVNHHLLDQLNFFESSGSTISNPGKMVTFLESALELVQTID
ncbi:arginine-specific demethylase JMJ20 isoform X2 [Andrographis paniculata]|uniref:arginine-specific demethylase JMJ20 isoform X2 n=1 Tax=Andrographis paniculata TaxID=175694 RepID=UPI0021E79307|nr:arginine-specific demethylase JMJ20 isoform X2 [Andrographis paniculata]